MKVLDLFSGIGGFSIGLEAAGMETVAFCEYDRNSQAVLRKNWPEIPIFDDVRTLNKHKLISEGINDIGLICGGYPCQPFSLAGQRRGAEDDRHLWPEMLRLVNELRPAWVIGENVYGHISMGLDEVLTDLEASNYSARSFVIPACAVDAPHRRDRIWTIAHSNSEGQSRIPINEDKRRRELVEDSECESRRDTKGIAGGQDYETKRPQNTNPIARSSQNVAHTDSTQREGNSSPIGARAEHSNIGRSSRWEPESSVGRVAHGVPNRTHRLKQLGNAVVPQVVRAIGLMIMQAETDWYRG